MKHLLLILLLFPLGLMAQTLPVDPETKLITFAGVIDAPGKTRKELHDKAKLWIAENYRDASAVTQFDSDSLIIIKGVKPVTSTFRTASNTTNLRFTHKIYFKDGKYKYSFSEFSPNGTILYHEKDLPSPDNYLAKGKMIKEAYASSYNSLTEAMKELDDSFKNGFAKLLSAKSDW